MKDNPIRRLELLVRGIVKQRSAPLCRDAIGVVFEIDPNDRIALFVTYSEILMLAEEAEELALTFKTENRDELFVEPIRKIKNILRSMNLDSEWPGFAQQFDPVTLQGLKYCVEEANRGHLREAIDDNELEVLLGEVESTLKQFEDSSIPDELKEAIIDKLDNVAYALHHYKYFGNKGLNDAVEFLTGMTITRIHDIAQVYGETESKSKIDKLFTLMSRLNTAVTANQNLRQIGSFIAGLLSGQS